MAPTPALMIQATGSNAGKSTLVAGLARVLVRRGLKVAPFKSQNMSNNAAVAVDGGEIGRAQAVQARAARMAPSVHMNPVLLKPETDTGAQIIVQGKRWGTLRAAKLSRQEGRTDAGRAGQLCAPRQRGRYRTGRRRRKPGRDEPARRGYRQYGVRRCGPVLPVVLLGDIDRGGVIASLAGTHLVLEPDERARIHGFIINKFRGDVKLFDQGLAAVTRLTGWPSLGVVPWLPQAAWLPAEDTTGQLDSENTSCRDACRVQPCTVLAQPDRGARISSDLDPLGMEPGVRYSCGAGPEAIPATPDVVILPGSKSTIGDFGVFYGGARGARDFLDIKAHVRRRRAMCWACAAATRCWANSLPIPMASTAAPGPWTALGYSM